MSGERKVDWTALRFGDVLYDEPKRRSRWAAIVIGRRPDGVDVMWLDDGYLQGEVRWLDDEYDEPFWLTERPA